MTTATRNRLRTLQDRFLGLPTVQRLIATEGEQTAVFEGSNVTYADLRTTLFPSLERDLKSLVRSYGIGR